jgi:hypothetical protein
VLHLPLPSRKLDYPGQLQRVTRRRRSLPQSARVRIAREQMHLIAALTREGEALKRELREPDPRVPDPGTTVYGRTVFTIRGGGGRKTGRVGLTQPRGLPLAYQTRGAH